jgi:putative tryptophan/tyrosine transport system substrate-binding protein
MRRREFIGLIGGAAAAWPLGAHAQQPDRMRRVGVLMGTPAEDAESEAELTALRDSLAKLGWVEDKTIHIDYRFPANPDQYPSLAKELIALRPEVIFAQSTPVAAALQRETRAIAIVFVNVSNPIGSGFVSSLARPGGNLTGVIAYEPGIAGKWLAMLKEIAPRLRRAALVANPKTTAYNYFLRNAKAAAASLDIEVVSSPINDIADFEPAIKSFARVADGALLTVPDGTLVTHRDVIIALAARYRLPAVYPWRYVVAEGGLMSYGVDVVDAFQQGASYVSRILRGENPADLPVQVPTKYETVLNLRTAKALGLSVPSSLLVRADEVIE